MFIFIIKRLCISTAIKSFSEATAEITCNGSKPSGFLPEWSCSQHSYYVQVASFSDHKEQAISARVIGNTPQPPCLTVALLLSLYFS